MIDALEVSDAAKRRIGEGAFAVKGVQDDAFEQVAERKVMVFRQGLKNFEQPFFDADAGLDALDEQARLGWGAWFGWSFGFHGFGAEAF
jgi:hypothetical protein